MPTSKKCLAQCEIYLDDLTFSAFWKLSGIKGLKKISVLGEMRVWQRLWRRALKIRGLDVVEEKFFVGQLRTNDGECIYMATRRLAGEAALTEAKRITALVPQLFALNEKFGRNTIRLFIAKLLHFNIEYYILRALIAQALSVQGHMHTEIWLKKPAMFDGRTVLENAPVKWALENVSARFYPVMIAWPFQVSMLWMNDISRRIKLFVNSFGRDSRKPDINASSKLSVLMLKEDDIQTDPSIRGQPHWLHSDEPSGIIETYIIDFFGSNHSAIKDATAGSLSNVHRLTPSAFWPAVRHKKNEKSLQDIRRTRRGIYWQAIRARDYLHKYYLLKVGLLLWQSELMAALALELKIKVFLTSEAYHQLADAIILVAPNLNITTIAYQYSNMGFMSPFMMSTSDKCLIFSSMYEKIYQTDGIAPKKFISSGYLYNGIANVVREKSIKHRNNLVRQGAKFIVCYFDESVQHDRWGMISKEDHLGELHALASAVVNDPTFGVVVKSQFMLNTPSQLYPEDSLLREAKETGRYLELKEGHHRNNIYPTEAALVADLCIGHKFGATAALEAAVADVRTVLLDSYGTRTLWDDIYSQVDIVYETMESLMTAIVDYKNGSNVSKDLGDWTPILHHFDPCQDGKAVERLHKIVENSLSANRATH